MYRGLIKNQSEIKKRLYTSHVINNDNKRLLLCNSYVTGAEVINTLIISQLCNKQPRNEIKESYIVYVQSPCTLEKHIDMNTLICTISL